MKKKKKTKTWMMRLIDMCVNRQSHLFIIGRVKMNIQISRVMNPRYKGTDRLHNFRHYITYICYIYIYIVLYIHIAKGVNHEELSQMRLTQAHNC